MWDEIESEGQRQQRVQQILKTKKRKLFIETEFAAKMSEVMKDSAIKLFGKTISLSKVVSVITVLEQQQSSSESSVCSQDSKDVSGISTQKHEDNSISPPAKETLTDGATSSGISDELKAPDVEEPSDDSLSPEKTLKNPDQLLPCPRCNSMDTKFCYYNNYNVKQPRHFCKNCQRYWTAGGVMRNVAVGSGRRKSKRTFIPNHHQIVDGFHVSSFTPNGFLVFGSDTLLDESITSSSNLDDGSRNRVPNHLSFYPPMPYWTGPVQYHWAEPQAHPTTPSTLGKHTRGGAMLMPLNPEMEKLSERSVLIPKTLRIHDPSDAAKSSIWSTLGIKNERIGSRNGTSMFKAFVAKGDRSSNVDSASMVRQANPAALLRSLKFQESA